MPMSEEHGKLQLEVCSHQEFVPIREVPKTVATSLLWYGKLFLYLEWMCPRRAGTLNIHARCLDLIFAFMTGPA